MKNFRKFAALILATVSVFVFAACSTISVEKLFKKVNAAEEKVTNAHIDVSLIMTASSTQTEESADLGLDYAIDMFYKPMKAKMVMKMSTGEAMADAGVDGKLEITTYTDQEFLYMNMLGEWFKTPIGVDLSTAGEISDSGKMSYLGTDSEGFVMLEEEKIDDIDTYVMEGKFSEETFKNISETMGLDTVFDEISGSSSEDMYSGMADSSFKIWVNKKTYNVVKFEFDMIDIMGEQVEQDEIISLEKMLLIIEFSDQNMVEDFEIPAEALSADELPGGLGGF